MRNIRAWIKFSSMVSRSGVKPKTNFAVAAGLLFSLSLPCPQHRVGVPRPFNILSEKILNKILFKNDITYERVSVISEMNVANFSNVLNGSFNLYSACCNHIRNVESKRLEAHCV